MHVEDDDVEQICLEQLAALAEASDDDVQEQDVIARDCLRTLRRIATDELE